MELSNLLTSVIDGDFDYHIVHFCLEYFGAQGLTETSPESFGVLGLRERLKVNTKWSENQGFKKKQNTFPTRIVTLSLSG